MRPLGERYIYSIDPNVTAIKRKSMKKHAREHAK